MAASANKFSWHSSFVMCFCIYTFYCLTSVFRGLSAIGVQMPIVMFCFVLLLSSNGRLRNSDIKLFPLALIFLAFNYVFIFGQGGMGMGDIQKKIGANFTIFMIIFPFLMVASGCFERTDKRKLYQYVLWLTLFTCITTILGTFQYDYPCRELATPYNPDFDNLYKAHNIGGYGFIYYLLLLIPILIQKIRLKYRLFDLIVLIASVISVIRSEYTTALLVMFIIFCSVPFIISKNRLVKFSALGVGIAVVFFSESILIWASSYFGDDSLFIQQRLEMLIEYNTYGSSSGDMAERRDLYNLSLNSFISNPIFGGMFSDKAHVGGHSEILDYLGHSGLFGLVFLIIMYRLLRYRTPVGKISFKSPFVKLTALVALFIASINTFLSPELMFGITVLPLLANIDEYGD